jgi:hypothetical protein
MLNYVNCFSEEFGAFNKLFNEKKDIDKSPNVILLGTLHYNALLKVKSSSIYL